MIGRISATAVLFTFIASSAFAQVEESTFAVAGVTGVLINTQTLSPDTGTQGAAANVDITAVTVGTDAAYYFTPRVGLGALIAYQSVSFGAEGDSVKVSGGLFGPLVKLRFPLGPRVDAVLSGGAGMARASVSNTQAPADTSKIDGFFWLGGAGLSFFFADNASFDVGARYQSSKLTVDEAPEDVKASGFLVNIGFSVYFR